MKSLPLREWNEITSEKKWNEVKKEIFLNKVGHASATNEFQEKVGCAEIKNSFFFTPISYGERRVTNGAVAPCFAEKKVFFLIYAPHFLKVWLSAEKKKIFFILAPLPIGEWLYALTLCGNRLCFKAFPFLSVFTNRILFSTIPWAICSWREWLNAHHKTYSFRMGV